MRNCFTNYRISVFIILAYILLLSANSHADSKASDFFKNPDREKDLLEALFKQLNDDKEALEPFTLTGEAGFLLTSGNTDTSMVKVAFESTHELENWSNRYQTQILQRTNRLSDQTVETARFEISAQLDYKLVTQNNRLFAYLEYDDNEFNRLRDQATFVAGWSHVVWNKKNSQFNYSVGPGFSHFRQTRNDITVEEGIVRGTVFYRRQLSENSRYRQSISAEVGEIIKRARAQASLTANVFDKVAMKFSLDVVYNDNVATQDEVFSTQTSISLVYQFF